MKFRRKDATGKPCCPSCGHTSLAVASKSTLFCNTCRHTFPDNEVGTVPAPKQKTKGSGVIAGRITIPQYRWGSGKV